MYRLLRLVRRVRSMTAYIGKRAAVGKSPTSALAAATLKDIVTLSKRRIEAIWRHRTRQEPPFI
jgi:hypothetical protein